MSPEDRLKRNLANPWWRLTSGKLYKIIIKGDDEGDTGLVRPFIPNQFQLELYKNIWYRNLILKARQLGFTTAVAILWLDTALFNANMRCGIIAQKEEIAENIFRDKVKFAYENLPPALLAAMPLVQNSASELLFAHNNSSIRVALSMRGSVIHRLHVSEFGEICAESPKKAEEIKAGSFPAVPKNGIIVIESTSKGQGGAFHDMSKKAQANHDAGKQLNMREYRFMFVAWWTNPDYSMDPEGVAITDKDHEYFDGVEAKVGTKLRLEQRAWYVATCDSEYAGSRETMYQEYPSTPEEAFQGSSEGCFYTQEMLAARTSGRVCKVPTIVGTPANTFWDIGAGDGTGIWIQQRLGQQNNFIKYIEGWGKTYAYYAEQLQKTGLVFDTHYLPHDADHVRQHENANESPMQILQRLMPGQRFVIVPRIDRLNWGIAEVRAFFPSCVFDEVGCKEGIEHLEKYHKRWNTQQACWSSEPAKPQIHREAADALRQAAQGYTAPTLGGGWQRKSRSARTS